MFWFPPAKENDREIGPYPEPPRHTASNDPSESFQFRPADLSEYFERQGRRKFGETVPEEAEFQGMWNVDIEGNYSVLYMLSGAGIFLSILGGIAYISTSLHDPESSPRMMAVEKDLPYMEKYYPAKDNLPKPVYYWSNLNK